MTKATGKIKKLITVISTIRGLIGRARASHENDRDPMGFSKGQNALEEAFNICVELTGSMTPLTRGIRNEIWIFCYDRCCHMS